MKKIICLLLVFLLALISAVTASAYTTSSNPLGATITELPDTAYTTGANALSDLPLFDLSLSTLSEVVFKGTYSGGYYTDSTGNRCYYYSHTTSSSSWTDNNIAVFKYRNCGTLGGESVDVYMHIEKVQHQRSNSTGVNGAVPLLNVNAGGSGTTGVVNNFGTDNSHTIKIKTEIRKHVASGDGAILTGYKVCQVLSDIDIKSQWATESWSGYKGYSGNFYVFESCQLNYRRLTSPSGYRWETPRQLGVDGDASMLRCGVYAETDASGEFTCEFVAGKFGTAITISPDVKRVTQKVKISYDANGGAFTSSGNPTLKADPVEYNVGDNVTLKSNSGDYAMEYTGYTFSCWNTKADGTGTDYNGGASFTLNEDTILYAKWTRNYTPPASPTGYNLVFIDDQYGVGAETYGVILNYQGATFSLEKSNVEQYLNNHEDFEVNLRRSLPFAGWFKTKAAARSVPYNNTVYHVDKSMAYEPTVTLANYAVNGVSGIYYKDSGASTATQHTLDNCVVFYAGWVPEIDQEQDPGDRIAYVDNNGQTTTTIKAFDLVGVQLRSSDIDDTYQDSVRNRTYNALRYVTSYSIDFLNELQGLSTVNGNLYAPQYGYLVVSNADSRLTTAGTNGFGLTTKTRSDLNIPVYNANCTKTGDRNHHYYDCEYLLSTFVVKYDNLTGADLETARNTQIEARAYVKYRDVQGNIRYNLDSYRSPDFSDNIPQYTSNSKGGCRTSFNAVVSALSGETTDSQIKPNS